MTFICTSRDHMPWIAGFSKLRVLSFVYAISSREGNSLSRSDNLPLLCDSSRRDNCNSFPLPGKYYSFLPLRRRFKLRASAIIGNFYFSPWIRKLLFLSLMWLLLERPVNNRLAIAIAFEFVPLFLIREKFKVPCVR